MFYIKCQGYIWQIFEGEDIDPTFEGEGPVQEALAVAKALGLDIVLIQHMKEAA